MKEKYPGRVKCVLPTLIPEPLAARSVRTAPSRKVFQSSRPGKVFCVTVVLSESLSRDQPRRWLSCLYASLCSSESYKISQCQDFNDGLEPLEARRYSRALQTQCLYHMTRCSCKFVNCQHVDLCKHHFDLTN